MPLWIPLRWTASLKDGYAVISREIAQATPQKPIKLKMIGSMAAGSREEIRETPGSAVQVLTGAKIPSAPTLLYLKSLCNPTVIR